MKRMTLKDARRRSRFKTLASLAAEIECSKSTLSKLERGIGNHEKSAVWWRAERALGVRLSIPKAVV